MVSAFIGLLVLLSIVSFASAATQQGYLCFIFFGAPGNINYPWSSATSLNFFYDDTPAGASGTAVTLINGTGTRTFTNKYGASQATGVTLLGNGVDFNDLLLFTDGSVVDGNGLSWSLGSATQFPGHGPRDLRTQVNVYTDSLGNIVEQDAFIVDVNGEAFYSTAQTSTGLIFTNITIDPSLPNGGRGIVDPDACSAAITNTNGLQSAPASTTVPATYHYNYFITDGATYSVVANLSFTMDSSTASVDLLGDYYQTITAIGGSRTYNYFPTSYTTTATVTGISSTPSFPDQRFYPFAQTMVPPSNFQAYTMNNAPFIDYDGFAFALSATQYRDGAGSGTKYGSINAYWYGSDSAIALEESHTAVYPKGALQQQLVVNP